MRTLTLTLDDSPEADDLLHALRTSPHVRLVQEEVRAPNGKVLPLVWLGDPDATIEQVFGGPPIELRPLAEIRRDWDKRPLLTFPLAETTDEPIDPL